MNKKLTVTVGIPAYNESGNIAELINNLLKQTETNFVLEKIIIASDQSTDDTEDIVRSIKSTKVLLIRNSKRLGQALTQNEIKRQSKSDVLILLNADVLPEEKIFITELVKPFLSNKNLGLVGAKVIPLKGETLVENVLNYSMAMKQEIAENFNKSDNIYLCHGRARAFSKDFIDKFEWVPLAGEDAYSYLQCKLLHFNFAFEPNAKVYYRSPQTLKDHFKQSIRYFNGRKDLEEYFSKIVVFSNFSPPRYLILKKMIKYLFKNLVYFTLYIGLLIYSKYKSFRTNIGLAAWDMSMSSKKLNK